MSRFLLPSVRAVGLFALSNAPDEELLFAGCRRLEELTGVRVVLPPAISPFRRFAGTDSERAAAFNSLIRNSDIDGLIAIRGGYGAGRCLELLDFDALNASGKFLCGYSDVSAVLLAAWKSGCKRLYHGPMICGGWSDENNFAELEAFTNLLNQETRALLPDWHQSCVIKSGEAVGPLVPVNLTMLQTLIGTQFMPDLSGAILAIEDIAVPAHDIDRKLNHLRQIGILQKLSALIFGNFIECEDSEWLPQIMNDYADQIGGPVIFEGAFGHQHPSIPLPCGQKTKVTAKNNQEILLEIFQ